MKMHHNKNIVQLANIALVLGTAGLQSAQAAGVVDTKGFAKPYTYNTTEATYNVTKLDELKGLPNYLINNPSVRNVLITSSIDGSTAIAGVKGLYPTTINFNDPKVWKSDETKRYNAFDKLTIRGNNGVILKNIQLKFTAEPTSTNPNPVTMQDVVVKNLIFLGDMDAMVAAVEQDADLNGANILSQCHKWVDRSLYI